MAEPAYIVRKQPVRRQKRKNSVTLLIIFVLFVWPALASWWLKLG